MIRNEQCEVPQTLICLECESQLTGWLLFPQAPGTSPTAKALVDIHLKATFSIFEQFTVQDGLDRLLPVCRDTHTTIEMHSPFCGQEASAESGGIIGSLWTSLPSRNHCAF